MVDSTSLQYEELIAGYRLSTETKLRARVQDELQRLGQQRTSLLAHMMELKFHSLISQGVEVTDLPLVKDLISTVSGK